LEAVYGRLEVQVYTKFFQECTPRLISSNNGAVMKIRESHQEIHVYLQIESFLAMKEKTSIYFLAYPSSRICSELFANFDFGSRPSKPLMQPPA